MAKLAVLTVHPRMYTTHCPESLNPEELGPHGVVRSDNRTPFSLANCSNVIGMKEPTQIELAFAFVDVPRTIHHLVLPRLPPRTTFVTDPTPKESCAHSSNEHTALHNKCR